MSPVIATHGSFRDLEAVTNCQEASGRLRAHCTSCKSSNPSTDFVRQTTAVVATRSSTSSQAGVMGTEWSEHMTLPELNPNTSVYEQDICPLTSESTSSWEACDQANSRQNGPHLANPCLVENRRPTLPLPAKPPIMTKPAGGKEGRVKQRSSTHSIHNDRDWTSDSSRQDVSTPIW
ncbi:unnamed protein product [Protopolystoma xenopodis]|uniref:Uncharacterized protein n=1 Tax=Protopolystoma xenopodis TaxID=117903 RepID=A0A448XB35_9PLAT|nr:unnamed protein product [Protopolystoma xenopodis]